MAALEWPVLTWNVPLGKVPDGVPESASLTIIELIQKYLKYDKSAEKY